MNIRTYKGDFSYAIFQRGQIYYRQKKLKEVIRDVKGNYRFIVEGTKNYNVIPDAVPDECRLAAQEAADSCPVAAIDIRA